MKTVCFLFWGLLLTGLSFSAVETKIRGGRMELLNKGGSILFTEGVVLDQGNDTLKATELETDKDRENIKAFGKVQFIRKVTSTETCQGFGDHGFYNSKSGEGYLIGKKSRARLLYLNVVSSTVTKTIDIIADRFDFTKGTATVIGYGNVYGQTQDPDTEDRYEFWAATASYFGPSKLIILEGVPAPVVHQSNGPVKRTIRGNMITYHLDTKKFLANGESEAVFIDQKR